MLLQDRHTPRWNTEREQLAARKMQQFPRRRQISKDVHGYIDYLQTWLDDAAIQLLSDAETLWLPQ